MKFRLPRAELQQTLARVQPGLASADVFEQSAAFVFEAGWLMTFNGEVACRTKSGLPKEFAGAARAKPLFDALEAIPDEEVEVDLSDPTAFVVAGTAGKRKWFRVRMEAEILLPMGQVELPEKGDWRDLPDDFTAALKTVLPAAGRNEQEFVAACVHFTPEFVECCDRMQLCRYRLPFPCDASFLVRAKSAKHLPAYDMTRFGVTESWVHFRNGAVILSCGRHDDEMENLDGAFAFRGTPMRLPKEAAAASRLAGVFSASDKTDDKVVVTLRPGRMEVSGAGAYGEGVYPVETSYDGDPLSFRVAPLHLAEMVGNYDQAEIGADAQGRHRLRVDGERWTYLVALCEAGEQDKKKGGAKGRRRAEPAPEPDPEPVYAEAAADEDGGDGSDDYQD